MAERRVKRRTARSRHGQHFVDYWLHYFGLTCSFIPPFVIRHSTTSLSETHHQPGAPERFHKCCSYRPLWPVTLASCLRKRLESTRDGKICSETPDHPTVGRFGANRK